ncbi:LysR family transcriptional regulator [Saccharothrix obliqua]|uniref:LysR family transcriptional regulator n=1 Tax=Saccharothrix obliqua TaxID=2861747 RepID=UPI001C5F7235|nr:LysR family transcriptional regulator [Saccharothrix obliqua]MBW4717190.1 LysR family transcriptional regulator [Saccharothrix obliqua]
MELREIECFLVVAEELHFRRTAERLHLSPARVSQTIRLLERRIGGALFERTSRRVRLTALGERFYREVRPAYQELHRAIDHASAAARSADGPLRLGFLGTAANELTTDVLGRFRSRHPDHVVTFSEVRCADPLGPLRAGDVDVLITRLPVREDDLTVGPVLLSEPRMLAVPSGHRFAHRESVDVEDLADEAVVDVAGPAPGYWWEFHAPARTPSGRRIPRGPVVTTFQELLAQVAAGLGVAPVVESVSRYNARPDVALVPIRDLPDSEVALVWRTAEETPLIRAFARIADEVAHAPGVHAVPA